jgi:hypothetical protein
MMQWLAHLIARKPASFHQFGRSINAEVNPEEPELFNAASEAFEKGEVLDAYQHFLHSLQNFTAGRPNENIKLFPEEGALSFELIQGSAKIVGRVTPETIEAYADIAQEMPRHVAIKRRLLERNYEMTYARFFLHDDRFRLKIYLDNTTMTPQKIFFPLRELALNADYEKEFITAEFHDEPLLNTELLVTVDDQEKALKYRFMQEWIRSCNESIKRLPSNDNTGMIAFTYLTLLLQIDYLIVPKQKIGQDIMHRVTEYFNEDEKLIQSKNAELETYITTLAELPYEKFAPQLYNTFSTFSPMERASDEEITLFIDGNLGKVRWYKSNRYVRVIPTIYRYMALYLLFNYGLHPALHALLHLFVEIHYFDFFKALGHEPLYNPADESFEKRVIRTRIDDALAPYRKQFRQLKPFGDQLSFVSLDKFSHSFYLQIKHLNFTEL